jgi:hypothetical protein
MRNDDDEGRETRNDEDERTRAGPGTFYFIVFRLLY